MDFHAIREAGTAVAHQDDHVLPNRTVNESERDLYRTVLGYLTENPDAMDTLDGIAEWWVMRQHIHTNVSSLSNVLRRLVEDGLVEDIGPAERPRYRLRRSSGGGTTRGTDK